MGGALERYSQHRLWRGRWIWATGEGQAANVYMYFRRAFECPAIDEATLYIVADTRYRLYINGKRVGDGAPQSQPYYQYYDVRDVGSYLCQGPNCLAVVVYHGGHMPDTRGGLLAELLNAQGMPLVATDESWRVKRADAWRQDTHYFFMNKCAPYQEHFDARRVPEGWTQVGFDSRGWDPATVIAGRALDRPPAVPPWTRLVPRDIPFMSETPMLPQAIAYTEECLGVANRTRSEDLSISLSAVGRPLTHSRLENPEGLLGSGGDTVVANSTKHKELKALFDGIYDPCVVLDFGRVITAYLELELQGVAGGVVEIGYAERLIDGRFNNAIEGPFAQRYTMTDGAQQFRTANWLAFRYVKLRFRNCLEPIRIQGLRAIVTTYPYEARGAFHSDDALLNRIFDISRYTIRLCSNEMLMDTPWREQAQWLGDVSGVTLGGIYACFGDTKLPAKFLRQSAANQMPTGLLTNITNAVTDRPYWSQIADYSLWWVMALWEHYEYAGDAHWIHAFYPHVLKVIQYFLAHLDAEGLVADLGAWTFIDWANVDRRGECAALNTIFCGALDAVERMAALKGDAHTRELVAETRQGIRSAFPARFWDEERGCFVDANVDGVQSERVSEHTNAAAIYWGLCDATRGKEIVERLYIDETISEYVEAQPFFTKVVLQALDKLGRTDLALEIIRQRWGGRMVAKGASSVYEEWGLNGSWRSGEYSGFMRTLSHAWSAHPAEFLIRNLMGLTILEPGCRRVQVQPKRIAADYACTYPTPLGPVEVRKEGDQIWVRGPQGVEIVR